MDTIQDLLAWYTEFIDKTNLANIESGISFHCLTMGGLVGGIRKLSAVLHNEGPGAFFDELSSLLFGSSGNGVSKTCMQRIIDSDIQTVLSISMASAVSSLSIFRIFSPFELAHSFIYRFFVEFLKLIALKNTLSLYGRRLLPSEAFITGAIAGFVINFLLYRKKRRWLRGSFRGGFKEMFSEYFVRTISYTLIKGIHYALQQRFPGSDHLQIEIGGNGSRGF